MASLEPLQRFDFAPAWVVPNATTLALDLANGRLLVAARRDVRALELETGREVLRFEPDGQPGDRTFVFRIPASRAIALAGNEIVAWNTSTGAIASRAPVGLAGWIDSISDDARLAVVAVPIIEAGPLRIWDRDAYVHLVEVATGRIVRNLGRLRVAQSRSTIVSEDGTILVSDRDGRLVEYGPDGRVVREHAPVPLEPREEPATVFPGQPDEPPTRSVQEILPLAGDAILVRGLSENIVQNRVTGQRLALVGTSMVETLVVTDDRKRILRRPSFPGTVEMSHDVATGEVTRFAGYGVFDWSPLAEQDGVIASSDYSGNVRVLRRNQLPRLGFPLDRIPAHVESIAISADGTTILLGCMDLALRVIDASRGTIRALPGHIGQGLSVGFLDDGRMWTCSSDHHRVWSADGKVERDESYFGSTYGNPQISPGGGFIHGVRESSLTVRSSETGKLVRDLVLPASGLREGGALLDDGVTYFSVTELGFDRWNLDTCVRNAEVTNERFTDQYGGTMCTPDHDGRFVVLHGAWTTYVWEPDNNVLRTIPKLHNVTRARFLGSRLLAVGDHEDDPPNTTPGSRIHILDIGRLERVDVLSGPAESIRAFTTVEDLVAAASEDRLVWVWRLPTG